jgi:hypothetical protein
VLPQVTDIMAFLDRGRGGEVEVLEPEPPSSEVTVAALERGIAA